MQNTTANYKLEINKPSREFECKITIGNNIYNNDELVNLTLEHTQPQEGFSIGDTISQSLDLTLLNRGDIIYSTSQIKVEIGLKIGSTIEYILMGIFNIDDIEKTDYTTKFTAYDNMIKFETPYFSSLGDKPTLKQVVNELSKITGIEFIGSLPNYTVSKLEGFTCREVLSYVASICGGNAVITRDGKFTIKSLSEIKKSIDGNNYFDYKREEVKYKIGKISCQIDENNILYKGSTGTDSMELGFENPWVTETILNDLYNKLNGLSYLGYSMKWQGDLSLDPYDIVTVTDIKNVIRKIPILSQKISYTGGLTSEIGAKGESKNKNSFSSSGSTSNKVNRVVMEQAVIKEALINKANIRDLEASNAKIENLQVKAASIESAIIGVAYISDLTAINANIQNLIAADAKINTALINKADITELNAVQGNITSLNSQIANIQTLVNGNLSSENIQAGGITSDKLTIANGFITNAMIANLDVSKINAGDISTNKFRIVSDNGGIEIVGATQQFKDKNNKVRIQMGQDAKGNFNFILRGEDGTTTLIDNTGIKEKAIADNLIKGNMVATDAIGEKQINYSSLITGLNKDTNTQLIKASKVAIDFIGQSLEVAFNSLKSSVDNTKIGGRNLIIRKDAYQNKFLDMTGNLVGNSTTDAMREYIKVKPGEILTFQKENSDEYFRYNWYDINKQFISRRPDRNNVFQWTVPEDTYYIWVSYPNTGNVKIERGNKPTDFSPAPEDIEGSIESVKEITESNSTTINVMQGQINTAINNTKIVKDGKTILLKDDYNRTVSKVDSINSTIGTHTTKINELTGNITSVDTKVNSVQRDLEGTKSTVSSHTNLIDGLNSKVSTQGASIEQLKNQITLKVNSTELTTMKNELIGKFDSIEIGGRNLLKDTSKELKSVTFGGWDYYFPNNITSWEKNKTLTGSIYLKPTEQEASCMLHVMYKDSSYKQYRGNIISAGKEGYSTVTITVPNSDDISRIRFSIRHSASSTPKDVVYYKEAKVEKGNKATDWTPAPEDVDSVIDTKANTVDVYKKSETYTKSETDSAIKIAKDSINFSVSGTYETKTNVESKISTAINNVQVGGRNLIVKSSNLAVGYLQSSGNMITSDTGWYTTDFISVEEGKQYIASGYKNLGKSPSTCFYNSSKTYISGINNGNSVSQATETTMKNDRRRIVTVPSGCVYMKFSFEKADLNTIKLEKGNKPTDYTPAPEDVDSVIDSKANSADVYKKSETYTRSETDSKINVAKDQINLSVSGTYETKTNVESKINTAKSNAINSAKSYTDGQITTVNKTITNKVAEIKATTDSISQKVSTTESKITTINNNISGLTNRVSTAESKLTSTSLTTTISSAITAGTSSISTTQFVMDKNGLTIKNGALTIKNKAGTTVLNSDTDGNLLLTGTIKSQSGERYVSLNSGGITFNDYHKNEQMLRIAISYFTANRDINGVTFAMPSYSDFIRFSHISKTDITNGWSSTDTQYQFFDLWSGDQNINGSAMKKGMTVYSPLYIKNKATFSNTIELLNDGTPHQITLRTSASDGLANAMGIYGNDGVDIGYRSGTSNYSRIRIIESSFTGTDDQIKSWGNYNFCGYTFHNAHIVAKSLSVQGSKNCLQDTKNYGSRLINAYETAEYYFGDLGFGKINEDGECVVYIDDILLECVNTDVEYHVFTQAYIGLIQTIEKYKTYFIVKGEPETSFSWELKAKRIGYENNRLDTQEIEKQAEEKVELFGDEDFKVKTSENILMSIMN